MTAGLDGVIGLPTRLLLEDTAADGLGEMNGDIDRAGRQLATTAPHSVVYMCTAGSFKDGQDGNEAIKDRLRATTGCPRVTTTSEAVVDAMATLGLGSVAMLTPYDEDLTRREVDFLAGHEITVTDFKYRDIEDNLDRGALPPDESYRFALGMDYERADGIFLSCANVQAVEIVEQLEAQSGRPVVTSSQATVWKALRLAGVSERIPGYGTLLREH